MALLLTRATAKFWYIIRRINGRLIRKNLGEWPMVLQKATRNKVMVWLQLNATNDSVKERQKVSQDDL